MKTLHDGTQVADDVPTKLVNGQRFLLTDAEIAEREARAAQALAAQIEAHLPAYRRKRELGGTSISLGGQTLEIQTDDEIQRKILAARVMAKEDADYTVNWKLPSGFVRLNATALIAISDAIRNHIQKCFDAEAAIKDQTFDSIEAVEAAFDAAYKDA